MPLRLLLFPFFVLGLFGWGLALVPRKLAPPAHRLFLAGISGLAFSHSLVYLGFPLWVSLLPALVGLAFLRLPRARPSPRLCGVGLLTLLAAASIVGPTKLSYDAHAIWFFHGELLFHGGRLFAVPWANANFDLTHPDYPKAIGFLCAQTAWLLGEWDERWLKITLLVPLLLSQLALYALPLRDRALWLLDALLLAACGYLIWNGQLDGYLACFVAVAVLFLGFALRDRDEAKLVVSLAALSLLPQLKNEGLFLCAILGGLGVTHYRSCARRWLPWLWFAPVVLWQVDRALLHLPSDLLRGFVWSTTRERLADPVYWLLFARYYFLHGGLLFVLLAALALTAWRAKQGRLRSCYPFALPYAAFSLYTLVVFAVYSSTYWNVKDHLHSSFSRVGLSLNFLLLAAIVFLLLPSEKVRARG